MLFDAHSHLDMLNENELVQELNNAHNNNVNEIISCSTSLDSNKKNLELCKKFTQIKCAIGLYPLDAIDLNNNEITDAFSFFKKNIKNVIGIGEVGLDYKYSKTTKEKEKQKEIFLKFIKLSKENNKPLIIHSRYAQRDVLKLLYEEKAEKVLLHSFTESSKLMKEAIENKWHIGVGLNILENELVQERIKNFSLDYLLFETDSPIKFNGEKATPSKIRLIANKVASLKDIKITQIEQKIENNYHQLFNI